MAKGYRGESCAEAIRASLRPGEVVTYSTLYNRIHQKGSWKDGTINQHLMGCVVNLPPARKHWKGLTPFLLLHPDGRYELFNSGRHQQVID